MSKFKLADLEKRVQKRAKASAKESYTRALLDKGVGHCVKKLNEEAFETGLAAVQESKSRVIAEASDLLYHLLVVLKARGVTLTQVEAELGKRTKQSGHQEKAARKKRHPGVSWKIRKARTKGMSTQRGSVTSTLTALPMAARKAGSFTMRT